MSELEGTLIEGRSGWMGSWREADSRGMMVGRARALRVCAVGEEGMAWDIVGGISV